MENRDSRRKDLEASWRKRVQQARRQYKVAAAESLCARTEFRDGKIAKADGYLTVQQAYRIERAALAEYRRVLKVLTDLILTGKIPPPV